MTNAKTKQLCNHCLTYKIECQGCEEGGGTVLQRRLDAYARKPYTCAELGVCQNRQPACVGCTVHSDPQPMRFAPGVIEFGARRSSLEWLLARRAYAAYTLLKHMLLWGSATAIFAALLGYMGWGDRFVAWCVAWLVSWS